jgi:protein involved in polysaccharide export with SLBB domain
MIGVMTRLPLLAPLLVLLGGLAGTARAQQGEWDPRRIYASREALEALQKRYEASAESPAYSQVLRDQARQQAEALQQRLENGDFQIGDRIRLMVERESTLTDTFTVVSGPEVVLPTIGAVPLKGVLRSEVEPYLSREIARYVRDPVVHARSFIRVSIAGEVARPGFYTLPTDIVISDALQAAQGFTPNAKLNDITIQRQNRRVWDARALQTAIAEGSTLDQLNVRAGDQIVVAARAPGLGTFESPLRTVLMVLTIPATVFGLIVLFRGGSGGGGL